MNIVMFSETYLPYINGVVTHIALLRKELLSLGHQVYVVTVSDVDDVCRDDYIIRCPGRRFKKIYDYRLGKLFSKKRDRMIAELKPDIFHMHNEFSMGLTAIRLAKKFKVPLVYTLHTDYKRHLHYLNMPRFQKPLQKMSLRYLKFLGRRVDTLLAPSPKVAEYLPEEKIHKHVRILANAVDQSRFSEVIDNPGLREAKRQELGIEPECLALVFLGRLGKEKRVSELMTAFAHAGLSPEQAKLFYIGGGPEMEPLRKEIEDLKLEDQVFLLGSFPNTEIPQMLSAMDVYVSASVSEMHSVSLLESTASGLQALVKLDPPNAWQIEEGENGHNCVDEADFIASLKKMCALSPEERAAMREKAVAYSRAHGIDRQAQDLLAIYRETIEHYKKHKESPSATPNKSPAEA